MLAALALMPLAWLIGEATEHAAEHTGPGRRRLSERELRQRARADHRALRRRGRAARRRARLADGLGRLEHPARARRRDDRRRRRQGRRTLAALAARRRRSASVALLLVPSPSRRGTGDPNGTALFLLSIPVSIVLLLAYVVITVRNLRIHRAAERTERRAQRLVAQEVARCCSGSRRVATAFVSEILVHSLDHFGKAVGLNEFFIAVVIVAIVGNAAEHGGAIVIAHRGNTTLATEIAITSSMQVALFVTPAVVPALVRSSAAACRSRSGWSRSSTMAAAAAFAAMRDLGRPLAALGGLPARRRLRARRRACSSSPAIARP